jgi:hypothetical protein
VLALRYTKTMAGEAVLTHPQRALIEQLLAQNTPSKAIARTIGRPGFWKTIQRYRTSVPGIVSNLDYLSSPIIPTPNVSKPVSSTPNPPQKSVPNVPFPPDPIGFKDLPPPLPVSDAESTPPAPSGLIARQVKLGELIDKTLERASVMSETQTDDNRDLTALKVMAPLIREAHNNIRLQGEITGELTAGVQNLFVSIVQAQEAAPAPYRSARRAAEQTVEIDVVRGDAAPIGRPNR